MTDVDRQAWLALYAAAWFQPTAMPAGVIHAEDHARIAAERADAALEALRLVRPEILR